MELLDSAVGVIAVAAAIAAILVDHLNLIVVNDHDCDDSASS